MRCPSTKQERLLQFAVVREDPRIELELIRRFAVKRTLLVASGGCTALALARAMPAEQRTCEVELFDANPAQLTHVRAKWQAILHANGGPSRELNVERADPTGLNECGNFEGLFRCFRSVLEEFVIEPTQLRAAFDDRARFDDLVERMIAHRYWPVAFECFFHDALLAAMFGSAAIQHAPPDSYPLYFRSALERGLKRADAITNPFLHHILLGHYLDRPHALPDCLCGPALTAGPPKMWLGELSAVPELEHFDLISLSNLTDWMSGQERQVLFRLLEDRTKPGATILLRTLNNTIDLEQMLGKSWRIERGLAADLHARDRSLFYSGLHIAQRDSR